MKKSVLDNCYDVAWATAKNIVNRDFRHISIVLEKNRVVAIGDNQIKSHPLAAKLAYRFENLHSELSAYIKIRHEYRTNPALMRPHPNKLTLVNFRFNNRGELRLSKPCAKCSAWCPLVFDEIYYSNNLGQIERFI